MNNRETQQVSKRVFEVFIQELEKDLGAAVAAALGEESFDVQQQNDLAVRFHKLKGGAGFLGYDDIADKAAQLEKVLLKGVFNDAQTNQNIKDLLHGIELAGEKLKAER